MTDAAAPADRSRHARRSVLIGVAALLAVIGLAGLSHAALGYALFLVATLLILAGVGLLAVFALTNWFDTAALRRAYGVAFWLGAWCYVFSVAALAGYFTFEALAGRIDWKLILFGPTVLAAIVILDIGIWRVIVARNLPTMSRFGDLWRRDALDKPALRRTLVDEVVLHRTLFSISPFRWVRHQLIFWGFALMFMVEILGVAFREAFPAFGWTDLWHQPSHPIRLAFDLAYDLTGLMILAGCVLALVFRAMAQGREDQKYTDTPTAVFLLIVVLTGFWAEGARLAMAGDFPGANISFVGQGFALISPAQPAVHEALWVIHMFAACAFIAYVPIKRMVHSCATPIGRLANSQQGLMAARRARVVNGLFRQGSA